MTIEGGCRCGAARYTLAVDALPPVYACHCLFCQTWSGSAFGLHALLPEAVLSTTGDLASYDHQGTGDHRSCAVCHTRLYNFSRAVPGMIVLRAGTLDASDAIDPIAHIWVRRKQPWLRLPDDVPNWPESPTPEQFAAALAQRG
jgi:hypothetical protein